MNNAFSIIVAEDDRVLNNLIQKNLQKEGFYTEGVLNGTDAIARAAGKQNALMLLDYDLHDMTGEQVIKTLIEKKRCIPFIVITGRGSQKIAVEMMKLGAMDYIVKNPSLTDILPFVIKKAIKELDREKEPANTKQTLLANDVKYYSLFENMQNGVACHRILVDEDRQTTDFVFLEINSAFERFTGLNRRDIINKKITEVMPEIARSEPDLISIYEEVAGTGKGAGFEFFFEPFEKWYSVAAYSPHTDYFVSIFEDITERKLAEKEFRKYRGYLMDLLKENSHDLQKIHEDLQQEIEERKRAEAEAVRAGQLASLGELAAGVAHEVNNPINGIINYAQLLSNKSEKESRENKISRKIIKEGNRIAEIVKNLLSFAREFREQKKEVLINEIIFDTLALVETQLRRDGIKLKVNFSPDLPRIAVQAQQIEQVFLNIISNARYALNKKYPGTNDEKALEITIKGKTGNNYKYVHITFHDKGIGIPEQILEKIINPFFTTKPHGTGLGLSISNGIISDHGGKIMINSIENEFTTIKIELPVRNCTDSRINYTLQTDKVAVR